MNRYRDLRTIRVSTKTTRAPCARVRLTTVQSHERLEFNLAICGSVRLSQNPIQQLGNGVCDRCLDVHLRCIASARAPFPPSSYDKTHQHPHERNTLSTNQQPVPRAHRLRQNFPKHDNRERGESDRSYTSSTSNGIEKDG